MSVVKCGNCGALVKLPERSSFGMGMSISKESVGNYTLDMEKENKPMTRAEERIATLKANGVDTSNYFALDANTLIKMENGNPVKVELDDTVKNVVVDIETDGDVFNRKLDGRWIMAQMFQMLNYQGRYCGESGYTAALNARGYYYQWDMLVNRNHGKLSGELIRMGKLQYEEPELFEIKEQVFNKDLIISMLKEHDQNVRRYVDNLPTRKLKGVLPYKRLGNRYTKLTGKAKGDVFVADLERDVYSRTYKVISDIRWMYDYTTIAKRLYEFLHRETIVIDRRTQMSKEFKDAFKWNGSYFTLMNLARFHGCTWAGLNREETVDFIKDKANDSYGWELLGFLKEFISENGFDFAQRMNELNS